MDAYSKLVNPKPENLLRLSFDSFVDYQVWATANSEMLTHIWRWHENIGNNEKALSLPGVCSICKRQSEFSVDTKSVTLDEAPFAFRADWWAARCECGLSALDRTVLQVLFDNFHADDIVYHVGHYSRFVKWLSGRYPNIISSQYEQGREPGDIVDGVRFEDLTRLSFPDKHFDFIICMEVLEHLPDYLLALREMFRTLKTGGRALMSFPWLGGAYYEHLNRAEIEPDGSIKHLLPAEYHGDPARPSEGILSFRSFGWKILDELREAGFSASAQYVFGPLHGFYILQNPIIVAVR